MRPYRVGCPSVGFALASIDDIHLIYIIVTVPVIVGEVHLIVGSFTGLNDHGGGVLVVALFTILVLAIIRHVVWHGIGSYDIKFEIKLATALVVEIVVYGAYEVTFVEPRLVGNII